VNAGHLMRVWNAAAFRRLTQPQPLPTNRLGPILEIETVHGAREFLAGRNHAEIDALDFMAVDVPSYLAES
jgi:hypothetical protein